MSFGVLGKVFSYPLAAFLPAFALLPVQVIARAFDAVYRRRAPIFFMVGMLILLIGAAGSSMKMYFSSKLQRQYLFGQIKQQSYLGHAGYGFEGMTLGDTRCRVQLRRFALNKPGYRADVEQRNRCHFSVETTLTSALCNHRNAASAPRNKPILNGLALSTGPCVEILVAEIRDFWRKRGHGRSSDGRLDR